MKPLEDLNVLDFSQSVAGPYATTLLADFGADVLVVEPPGGGDQRRILHGSFMPTGGRNKQSIELDLKSDGADEVVASLTEWADVVVHNYTPGTMERLGCDYQTLSEWNENLIYASITGFGESGPYSARPGFDPIAQAMSGLMWVTGEPDRKPSRVGTSPIDYGTGLFTAFAVLMALHKRDRTGEGVKIETSLFETAAAFMGEWYTYYSQTGNQPQRLGHTWEGYSPTGLFETADELMYLSVPYQPIWKRFCQAMNREDWIDDPRFATNEDRLTNRDELYSEIEDEFQSFPREELIEKLLASGVPAAELQTVKQAAQDSHLRERDMVTMGEDVDGSEVLVTRTPIKLDGDSHTISSKPSRSGEQTKRILRQIGFDEKRIESFLHQNVVNHPDCSANSSSGS